MIAGPAYRAAAEPVSTKIPAPMTAPIPKVIKLIGPRARFSVCSPSPPWASRIRTSIGLVANKGLPMQLLLWGVVPRFLRKTAKLDANIVGAQHAAPLLLNFYDALFVTPERLDHSQ